MTVPNVRPPTFLERIGLKKRPATELVPIHVCSPECAQRVRNDKNAENYLIRVIAERGGSSP